MEASNDSSLFTRGSHYERSDRQQGALAICRFNLAKEVLGASAYRGLLMIDHSDGCRTWLPMREPAEAPAAAEALVLVACSSWSALMACL